MILLSDFCNRLAVSSNAQLKLVITKNSVIIVDTLKNVYSLGFLLAYAILTYKYIKILFRFINGEPTLRGINIISKPSLKLFVKKKHLQRRAIINKSYSSGFVLYSTSRGVMPDIQCILNGIGGLALLAFY